MSSISTCSSRNGRALSSQKTSNRPWFTKYTKAILFTLVTSLSFILPAETFSQSVQAWGDAPPAAWTASTLNNARSDYFQGEVIPFVYKFSSTGLVTGSSYTFNIRYDYYRGSGNAGGYAYMTTYNVSRDPDESAIGANPTLDNTATAANVGNFYTVNADITSAAFAADNIMGSTISKVVTVTFTFTGTPGDDVIVYFGLFLAKKGSVPAVSPNVDPSEGASHWPGGSLMVIVSGTGGGGNVGNNPGAGGVVEGVISGVKYGDADQSGTQNGSETGLPGWTIYLDLNNNDTYDGGDVALTTTATGTYSFGDLLPGTYTVREVNQTGWTQTQPGGSGEYTIVLDAANFNHPDKNFGNYECPTSGGTATAAVSPICSGSSTTVSLSGHVGNIVKWQYSTDGSTWNDIVSTDNPLNTGALTTTTQFRAVVQSGACNAQNSVPATVNVDAATVGGSAAAAVSPICSGSSTTVSLTGNTGAIVKWQWSTDGSTWNDIVSTDNPYNTGALTTTTQFRAVVQNGTCNTQNSSPATVNVDAASVGGSAAAAVSPICSGSSTTVSLSGNTGAIVKWQYSTDGITWNDIASTANPLN
ncbi:MAG TPA: SdrD B-like domain-containing protein, partial [Chitinophagaceae bacterium]